MITTIWNSETTYQEAVALSAIHAFASGSPNKVDTAEIYAQPRNSVGKLIWSLILKLDFGKTQSFQVIQYGLNGDVEFHTS